MRLFTLPIGLFLATIFLLVQPNISGGTGRSWNVFRKGNILQISYGSGTDYSQYAALHLNSSYLRVIYGPNAGWGTSVVLLPAFWSGGVYYQGAPVVPSWHADGEDLVISLSGSVSSLTVVSDLRFSAPTPSGIEVRVTTNLRGSVALDPRPGEAFKPVSLSSMRVSPTAWDTDLAYVGCENFTLPASGWMIPSSSPAKGEIFGLRGGSSAWKANAPAVEIQLTRPLSIAGWVKPSTDPNDDNVGYWAATDQLIDNWSYTIRSAPFPAGCRTYLPLVFRK